MIPAFGGKKAPPAFQVKKASTQSCSSTPAQGAAASSSPPPHSAAAIPEHSTTSPASALTAATAPAVLPTKDVDAGIYSSDEDFEKENILIDQQVKKATTKSKKSKVKKDPGAPKRPASSYTLFCKQV